MTIVAGFRVQQGVLLCADTMYTGAMKIQQQKIFPVTFSDSAHPEHLVFALAGSEAYGKMAIDDCTEALRSLGPDGRTLKNVKMAPRSAIKAIHDGYIYSRPEYERPALEFGFVIGAWLPKGGGAKLFSTSGSAVNIQTDYSCLGTGDYLGHYLIRPVFTQMLNMNAVVLLATQVLAAAKGYDASCGGVSTFCIITDGGELRPLYDYFFFQVEGFVSQYDQQTRSLLFQIADAGVTDENFNRTLGMFVESVKHLRESWKRNADIFERGVRISEGSRVD